MVVEAAWGKSLQLRARLGGELFQRVAGPEGAQRHAQINAAGDRWFAEDRPIRRVHGDAAMFVGGLRALLLQSLHPLAMAGVAQHSDFRHDPWGRLQRTSFFLAVTTFGPAQEADRAVARVRGVHRRIHGITSDGRAYAADDPHLLSWVHLAEVDSFLVAYQRYGVGAKLDQRERDVYIADTAVVATKLGVNDPPRSEAELRDQLAEFRPELAGTAEAREAARFLLLNPPLPIPARLPYAALAAAAVSLLPIWARWPLRLPYMPAAEATVGRLAGRGIVAGISWAMASGSSRSSPSR